MKQIYKIEIKRTFINRLFVIALLIGCSLAVGFFITDTVKQINNVKVIPGFYMDSVFNTAMMFYPVPFCASLFFSILPLLVALPFSDSYVTDKNSGYIKNIITRTSKKDYYKAKYLSVFISGGVVAVFPLLLNLFLTALVIPSIVPDSAAQNFPLFSSSFAGDLYYTHPFIYSALYLLLIFITSGIMATICLGFSDIINFRFIVILTPFFIYLLSTFIGNFFLNPKISIQNWIYPSQMVGISPFIIIIELLIMNLFVFIMFFIKGNKEDIL